MRSRRSGPTAVSVPAGSSSHSVPSQETLNPYVGEVQVAPSTWAAIPRSPLRRAATRRAGQMGFERNAWRTPDGFHGSNPPAAAGPAMAASLFPDPAPVTH